MKLTIWKTVPREDEATSRLKRNSRNPTLRLSVTSWGSLFHFAFSCFGSTVLYPLNEQHNIQIKCLRHFFLWIKMLLLPLFFSYGFLFSTVKSTDMIRRTCVLLWIQLLIWLEKGMKKKCSRNSRIEEKNGGEEAEELWSGKRGKHTAKWGG